MNQIKVLDQITIDKIAAGEVIERPASVIKELVENSIDAKATSVVVEIKDGGISFMRISDNGSGIPKSQVPSAFLRHSTSKIRSIDDLKSIGSLGFRGEALSSIAAVAQVELLTKTKDSDCGTRYLISGGVEEGNEDSAVIDGTTFLIRQLFYNTPVRRKFLKTAMTEASHVNDLMMRIALSHPEISFKLIINGSVKLQTSGNGDLKNVIYQVYGRDITNHLLKIDAKENGLHLTGFLGEPIISRGNRNFENYFINHRYIKSNLLSKALEDGYKDFSMQHRFPFAVLNLEVEGEDVDVNVHPTKMDVRFANQQQVYNFVYEAVSRCLHGKELIPEVTLDEPKAAPISVTKPEVKIPGNSIKNAPIIREKKLPEKPPTNASEEERIDYFLEKMRHRVASYHEKNSSAEVADKKEVFKPAINQDRIREAVATLRKSEQAELKSDALKPDKEIQIENTKEVVKEEPQEEPKQMNLFDDHLLKRNIRSEFVIVGQVFDTYWIIEYQEQMYIIDQHAAHERVLYEKTLKSMKNRQYTSQQISPPIVLELSMQEEQLLIQYMDQFTSIGFTFEEFGSGTYTVTEVPDNLFSIGKKELLIEMLDGLSNELNRKLPSELIDEKIASLSCKAAVKGNMKLSEKEVETLIGELLLLDNPYHCPHGRPVIISMSKKELEKKFKRIV